MESIISYFGTYKPAADGAVASFKFEYLCTLGFAAIVIFLGRAIVARSETLRKYAIPAPVISGLIFSIIVSCIKGAGIVGISFDATIMKDLCQNLFFLCVGFGFSAKMLRHAGGKLCALIAFAACLLITCQDLLGYALSQLIGMHSWPFSALPQPCPAALVLLLHLARSLKSGALQTLPLSVLRQVPWETSWAPSSAARSLLF